MWWCDQRGFTSESRIRSSNEVLMSKAVKNRVGSRVKPTPGGGIISITREHSFCESENTFLKYFIIHPTNLCQSTLSKQCHLLCFWLLYLKCVQFVIVFIFFTIKTTGSSNITLAYPSYVLLYFISYLPYVLLFNADSA